jgi:hypothetical protein
MRLLSIAIVTLITLGLTSITRAQNCNDPIPKNCKTARALGENKGCACFECSPGTREAKVVCTNDPDKKRALLALVPRAPASASSPERVSP